MTLSEIIVNGLYSHFYNVGLRDSISKQKDSFFIKGFEFVLNLNKRDLEILILPPGEVDLDNFQQHFQDIQTPCFWEKFPLVKKKRSDYKDYLLKRQLIYDNGNYSFKAEVKTQSDEKIMYSILNYVVKPIILFNVKRK